MSSNAAVLLSNRIEADMTHGVYKLPKCHTVG